MVVTVVVICLNWLRRNDIIFNSNICSPFVDYLSVYQFALFMVISITGGEAVYTVGGSRDGYFFYLDDNVIYRPVL
jgi:hypothetical protein